MRYNAMFASLVTEVALNDASQRDITDLHRSALEAGWTQDESGAWLLEHLKAGYYGSRSAFTDLTGYEAAVNGCGIPDLDLTSVGVQRARDLARRGYAFARMALLDLQSMPNHPQMHAYVSVGCVEMDDGDVFTGSVTFVASHHGEPEYLANLEGITDNAVLVLDLSDCNSPLPQATARS